MCCEDVCQPAQPATAGLVECLAALRTTAGQPEEEERMDMIIYNVRIIENIDIDRHRER